MDTQKVITMLRSRLEKGDIHAVDQTGGHVLEHETVKNYCEGYQTDLFLLALADGTFNLVKIDVYENKAGYPQVALDLANFKVQDHAETAFLEVSLAHCMLAFGMHVKINKSGRTIKNQEEFDGEKVFANLF